MNEIKNFENERSSNIESLGKDQEAKKAGLDFMVKSAPNNYTYNFTWLGRPIIQYPQDIVALQELIWKIQPDLIIETGIAHGGSLIFSASMLELIGGSGEVLGIDIDIREHNLEEIEKHPMFKRITMFEGSSVDQQMIEQVHSFARDKERVMVILDSNHTHDHVLDELRAYATLVSVDSYLIVFDTAIEDVPEDFDWGDRPWGKGNNPKTAVWQFLKEDGRFVIDESIHNKLLISVAPDGFLRRVS